MFKGIWFLLKLYYKYSKISIFYLISYTLLGGLLPLASVVFPGLIVNELLGSQRIEQILFLVCLYLLILLFGNTLNNFLNTQFFLQGFIVSDNFNKDLSIKMYETDLQNIESPEYLDLKNKAERFLHADGYGFGGVLRKASTMFSGLITLLGLVSIISYLSVWILLLFVFLVLLTTWVNSKVKKANIALDLERPEQERKLMYDSELFLDYRYAKEIRVNTMGDWLVERLINREKILRNFYQKMNYNTLKLQVLTNGVSFIQQGAAYGYLIYKVLFQSLSIGDFTVYLNAANSFSNTMLTLMDNIVDVRRFSDYFPAVHDYLNMPRDIRDKSKNVPVKTDVPPEIVFHNVSFQYPGQDFYALKDVNITIRPGEKLSVVGENGAGKTTFVKLLMRLYEPTDGYITVNGINIADYDYDQYMKLFSTVFQDFVLFSMSLKENITLNGDNQIENEGIESVLKSCGYDKFEKLPKGVETQVHKNFDKEGIEPSGGEAQKIAIARAKYKNGEVVILDEPTSALDPRAEYEIYQKFHDITMDKTSIFISHRLSSARFCDRIAVFSKGEIVEYGTHEELIHANGMYAELFSMQSQFYVEEEQGEETK